MYRKLSRQDFVKMNLKQNQKESEKQLFRKFEITISRVFTLTTNYTNKSIWIDLLTLMYKEMKNRHRSTNQ